MYEIHRSGQLMKNDSYMHKIWRKINVKQVDIKWHVFVSIQFFLHCIHCEFSVRLECVGWIQILNVSAWAANGNADLECRSECQRIRNYSERNSRAKVTNDNGIASEWDEDTRQYNWNGFKIGIVIIGKRITNFHSTTLKLELFSNEFRKVVVHERISMYLMC